MPKHLKQKAHLRRCSELRHKKRHDDNKRREENEYKSPQNSCYHFPATSAPPVSPPAVVASPAPAIPDPDVVSTPVPDRDDIPTPVPDPDDFPTASTSAPQTTMPDITQHVQASDGGTSAGATTPAASQLRNTTANGTAAQTRHVLMEKLLEPPTPTQDARKYIISHKQLMECFSRVTCAVCGASVMPGNK